MKPPEDFSGTAPHFSPQCTILVAGLPDGATEDLVINYFENRKRSMGGPVSNVEISPELQTCKVTFESSDGRCLPFCFSRCVCVALSSPLPPPPHSSITP